MFPAPSVPSLQSVFFQFLSLLLQPDLFSLLFLPNHPSHALPGSLTSFFGCDTMDPQIWSLFVL
jgi:hypothetical protein